MAINKLLLSGKNWKFKKDGTQNWLPASVPGCVHADLLKNKLIPDPFIGLNATKIQWIEDEDWEYMLEFRLPRKYHHYDFIEIYFEGLDTFAEVYLNGIHVSSSDNMFLPVRIEIAKFLKKGTNQLKVLFKSPYKTPLKEYRKSTYTMPANNDKGEKRVSPFARKAPYMYGWDWAPRLLTSGIWKDVYLVCCNTVRLAHCSIKIEKLEPDSAVLEFHYEADVLKTGNYSLIVTCDGQDVINDQINSDPGKVYRSARFILPDPEYWWPRGYGGQKLYEIGCMIRSENTLEDSHTFRLGLRTISLKTNPDLKGSSFIFNINGKDIYIRGANLIPAEYFPSSISDEKYQEIVQNAVSTNMNMIRAWGGGIYEADQFYELCDEHGILVWQDFMFSCSMYPSDDGFLSNVEKEVRHHVKRLKNHPSVVLWCGNNEIQEGFYTWGWQELPGFDKDAAWKSYTRIFHTLIPRILEQEDGTRPYQPTSPSPGVEGEADLFRGDYHYWDLVKNIQPYTVYANNVGRFMSEFGFKSYPEMRSLLSFLEQGDLWIHSEAMEYHQGWETGAELVEKNLAWFYPPVKDFNLIVYQSQLLQADAIEFAIENHRLAKPWCMGTIYWQLNDCWPAASWSGIDYYGRWKALHYRLKNAFRDVLLVASSENGFLKISVVSDLPDTIEVQLQFRLIDFSGKVLAEENLIRELNTDSSQNVYRQNINEFLNENEIKSTVLVMHAYNGNHLLANKMHFFVKPAELKLEDPEISLNVEKKFSKYFIFIRSKKLAKSIYLVHSTSDGFFSDNYFDLLPGEDKIVVFEPSGHCECKIEDFMLISLWNCLQT